MQRMTVLQCLRRIRDRFYVVTQQDVDQVGHCSLGVSSPKSFMDCRAPQLIGRHILKLDSSPKNETEKFAENHHDVHDPRHKRHVPDSVSIVQVCPVNVDRRAETPVRLTCWQRMCHTIASAARGCKVLLRVHRRQVVQPDNTRSRHANVKHAKHASSRHLVLADIRRLNNLRLSVRNRVRRHGE